MGDRTTVDIKHEVQLPAPDDRGYVLTFQHCMFHYDDDAGDREGFRFDVAHAEGSVAGRAGAGKNSDPSGLVHVAPLGRRTRMVSIVRTVAGTVASTAGDEQ